MLIKLTLSLGMTLIAVGVMAAISITIAFPMAIVPSETPTCIYVESPPAEKSWSWIRQTKTPAFKLESEIKNECYVVVDPNTWPTYTL